MSVINNAQYKVVNANGAYQLQNLQGETLGHITSVMTSRNVYHLNTWNNDPSKELEIPQIFMAGSLRAMGRINIPQPHETLTSPLQYVCIVNKDGEAFQVPAGAIQSAPQSVMLTNSQGQSVYVDGNFAVTNFHDQKSIDAEFDRQMRVHKNGLDVNPADLRMQNFPVLGRQ